MQLVKGVYVFQIWLLGQRNFLVMFLDGASKIFALRQDAFLKVFVFLRKHNYIIACLSNFDLQVTTGTFWLSNPVLSLRQVILDIVKNSECVIRSIQLDLVVLKVDQ